MPTPKVTRPLETSEFKFQTENFEFIFSSNLYLTKFKDRYVNSREDFYNFMKARFNIEVLAYDYADFMLYNKLEIRGFRVIKLDSKEVITCLNDITLDGVIRTTKELIALSEDLTVN